MLYVAWDSACEAACHNVREAVLVEISDGEVAIDAASGVASTATES